MVKFLDEFVFLRIVKKYDGDKYVKHFSCWNQLLTLMFGQLTGKPSLQRFIIASAPIQKKFYSLGMGRNVTRSNLSKANNTRDYRIFEEFAYHTVGVAQKMRIENIFKLGGKLHDYPEVLRRFEYYDDEQDRVFVFLTNALSLDALEVANLYRGETENAVRIQIYAAITAYCMVAIIQHETKTELSIYEVLETASMVLTDKTPLYDLLCNSNDNIDNELDESSGPTLF